MSEPEDVLRQLGVRVEGLDRIRLGRGVVGKASYVAGAAVIALGFVAWALRDPTYLLIDACLIAVVFGTYFAGSLWFSNRHPGVALLEGAELIQWRQMDMGAKNMLKPPEGPNVTPPLIEKPPAA